MSRRERLTAAVLASALAFPALAEEGWFTTRAGMRVETPEIAGLDCARMRAVLDAIDATGYRRETPRPAHEDDMALFDYENEVSAAYWADCVRATAEAAPAAAAFAGGYQPDAP